MANLSAQDLLRLKGSEQVSVIQDSIEYNGVKLDFYQLPPGKMVEIMLVLAQKIKDSPQAKQIICQYLPQLEDIYEDLSQIALLEIVCQIFVKAMPGFQQSVDNS